MTPPVESMFCHPLVAVRACVLSVLLCGAFAAAPLTSAARTDQKSGPTADDNVFLSGYHAFQKKDWDTAIGAFSRTLLRRTILADYAQHFLGVAQARSGLSERAKSTFERLLREHPNSVWHSDAATELAELAFVRERYAETLDFARQARDAPLTGETVRHRSALLMAQAHERRGNLRAAYRGYQTLRATAHGTQIGRAAKIRSRHLQTQRPDDFGTTTPQDVYDEARLLRDERDLAAAAALAERFRTDFIESRLRPEALLLLADIYTSQGRSDATVQEWERVVEEYPGTPYAADALHRWGRALWNRDADSDALVVFTRLTAEYPRHDLAANARHAVGRIAEAKRRYAEAAAAYRVVIRDFQDTPQAREAHWRLGWLAYTHGNYQDARRTFREMARATTGRVPTSETARALYWQARVNERIGRQETAAALYARLLRRYPHDYYALWAEQRLDVAPPVLPFEHLSASAPPSPTGIQAARYRRCQTLEALGLWDLARRELDAMRHVAPETRRWKEFFITTYHRLNNHTAAFRLTRASELSSAIQHSYVYPRAYWDLINGPAGQRGVDGYLVVALIRQESLFDPVAVSHANALGLMQLLPRTAARFTDAPLDDERTLFEPVLNIRLGTRYLGSLLERYDGSLPLALAAYNAGEAAADKWLAQTGHLEADEFIETITYRETRAYVKLVLRNYRTYLRLYTKPKAPLDIRLP